MESIVLLEYIVVRGSAAGLSEGEMDLVWVNQETATQTKAELGKALKQIRMGALEGLVSHHRNFLSSVQNSFRIMVMTSSHWE